MKDSLNNNLKEYLDDDAQSLPGPIYRRIADAISFHISSGQLKPGNKLPTHRSLADTLEITVGTVTRAYAESERRGLVEARVGAGTYVRSSNVPGWQFDQAVDDEEQCDFGYNLPPYFDRSIMLKQAMNDLANNPISLNQMLLYQPPEGFSEHRHCLADWLKTHNVQLHPDRVRFTSGAQNAMQIVLSAFCQNGDTLLVEKLTYPGLINLARQEHLTLKPIDMDEEGLIPASLESACRQYNPRFIYATPTMQNPTTSTMGQQRRRDILAVCKRHGVYLIEDDVNGFQHLERSEPLVNLDSEQVIYIGSLSKCLAPGLRVGFLQAPKELTTRLTMTIQNQCWMVSPVLTGLACQLIKGGYADQTLATIRQEMLSRYKQVQKYLGEFGIQTQSGCFHGWLLLPKNWGLSAFVAACASVGVSVKPGELFVPPGYSVPPAVRIAFSAPPSSKRMVAGLQKIKELLLSEPELRGLL